MFNYKNAQQSLSKLQQSSKSICLSETASQCNYCALLGMCLFDGINNEKLEIITNAVVKNRLRLRKGEFLFRTGTAFSSLFAVKSGAIKKTVLAEDGREQVADFCMKGDVLGLEGVGRREYNCNAIALEECEVCVLSFDQIKILAKENPKLQHNLHQLMSVEILREHSLMLLLGSMKGEERLASFLMNLSRRYSKLGYSSTEFNLLMTREEIGSYLGLKLETVSRFFSHLQEKEAIKVQGRSIKIINKKKLQELCNQN